MSSKIKLSNVFAAIAIAAGFVAFLIIKLMQNAAHRDNFFDWEYVFSKQNMLEAAALFMVALLIYAICRFIKYLALRNHDWNG